MTQQLQQEKEKKRQDQRYFIEVEGIPYWKDSEKLIFNSYSELKEYVSAEIKALMKQYPLTTELKEKHNIKKVYKRIQKMQMFEEKSTGKGILVDYKNPDPQEYRRIGYVFEVEYRQTNGDYDQYIIYYCYRVKQKDLGHYANFRRAYSN